MEELWIMRPGFTNACAKSIGKIPSLKSLSFYTKEGLDAKAIQQIAKSKILSELNSVGRGDPDTFRAFAQYERFKKNCGGVQKM